MKITLYDTAVCYTQLYSYSSAHYVRCNRCIRIYRLTFTAVQVTHTACNSQYCLHTVFTYKLITVLCSLYHISATKPIGAVFAPGLNHESRTMTDTAYSLQCPLDMSDQPATRRQPGTRGKHEARRKQHTLKRSSQHRACTHTAIKEITMRTAHKGCGQPAARLVLQDCPNLARECYASTRITPVRCE